LLLHGSKRNEVLILSEVEQYGLDSFADRDYVSIYGMAPREWYRLGIRMLGRTVVECTRDSVGNQIGRDVASIALRMSPTIPVTVIDLFAGSCNTLFWILRHLPNADGFALESDAQVFQLTRRNLAALGQEIKLLCRDYLQLLDDCETPLDRAIVAFVAPPWGRALDEAQGLDLRCTVPPITEVIDQVSRRFAKRKMLFAIQIYDKVDTSSLTQVQAQLDWTEVRVYKINEEGRNHGILLGAKGWTPH
jgi:hypothetical protein